MRHTGKYWWLTILSGSCGLLSSVLVSFWNENTIDFDLWFDIVPGGFGM